MFIHIDGIDGAGKSTLLATARSWAETNGKKIFDSITWSKEHHYIPTVDDVGDADVLFTAEPTHAWIGAGIRNELIRTGTTYGARIAAEAFSIDRALQYTRLILPFLASRPDRIVIQDRGVISSLAYQPLQAERNGEQLSLDGLCALAGNRIAIEHAPNVFIFLDIDPSIAQSRLANRTEKVDDHVFDDTDFQIALAERFRDPKTTAPLTKRGMRVIMIDGSKTKEEVAQEMLKILSDPSHF